MKIAQVTTPYAGGATLDHKKTVYDYAKWLKENSGGRPYFMVLQAFSYEKLGQDWMLEPTAGSKFPTNATKCRLTLFSASIWPRTYQTFFAAEDVCISSTAGNKL